MHVFLQYCKPGAIIGVLLGAPAGGLLFAFTTGNWGKFPLGTVICGVFGCVLGASISVTIRGGQLLGGRKLLGAAAGATFKGLLALLLLDLLGLCELNGNWLSWLPAVLFFSAMGVFLTATDAVAACAMSGCDDGATENT